MKNNFFKIIGKYIIEQKNQFNMSKNKLNDVFLNK